MFKTFPARRKDAEAGEQLAEGQFRALVSVFNVKDSMGDVIVPGAFTDTLADWAASGDRIPVYWSHQMADPDYNIGEVLEAKETEDGLEVLAQLDLDPDGSPKARQAHRLLKRRGVTQFSFAYEVLDGGPVEKDGEAYNELRKLQLHEVSPTGIGANQATDLLAVKDAVALLKAGRVLSAKNESTLTAALADITSGVASIKSVLAAVATGDDGKASTTQHHQVQDIGTGEATPKEPSGATDKEPSRKTPVSTLAADIELLALGGIR